MNSWLILFIFSFHLFILLTWSMSLMKNEYLWSKYRTRKILFPFVCFVLWLFVIGNMELLNKVHTFTLFVIKCSFIFSACNFFLYNFGVLSRTNSSLIHYSTLAEACVLVNAGIVAWIIRSPLSIIACCLLLALFLLFSIAGFNLKKLSKK